MIQNPGNYYPNMANHRENGIMSLCFNFIKTDHLVGFFFFVNNSSLCFALFWLYM